MTLAELLEWARSHNACASGIAWGESFATIEDLYAAPDPQLYREWLAENPATPEVLAMLAGDSSQWVRERVARNPATPAEVLTVLAGDSNEWVRVRVAENLANRSVS